ncbi:MAG: TIGR02302 family protein [Litoreibacter sp.]|nr:TIGR02302 family protein [Litoreibacter sp.]
MTQGPATPDMKTLRWPLRLTWAGLFAERSVRAFWPLWSVFLLIWTCFAFELQAGLSVEARWLGLLVAGAALIGSSLYALRRFRWPSREDALVRLDQSLPGNPVTAAFDNPAIGATDPAALDVWNVHVARMQARLAEARAVPGDLRLSRRDPFALRYVAVLAFVLALVFGSVWRVDDLGDLGAANAGDGVLAGPSWEIWIEPPLYTGKPTLYLNDIAQGDLSVPTDSLVIVRLYGELGKLEVIETVSDAEGSTTSQPAFDVKVAKSGALRIAGVADAEWQITAVADARPSVTGNGPIERKVSGELSLPFAARDDYSVERGEVEITLDLERVDRRYGLAPEPEARASIFLDLPMPFSGDRADFSEILIENLSEHPWAGLPVEFKLSVEDAARQPSMPEVIEDTLAGRRFFQPIAKAVVEQRRDILWSVENTRRVTQVLRAITYKPEEFFPNEQAYLTLRRAITVLDLAQDYDLGPEKRDEVAEMLWRAALLLEEGRLNDALDRLRRAQERLSDAMREGATDEEIAELMRELSEAMRQYMEQLAQEGQDGENQQLSENQQTQEITGDQLQDMLDRLQELMEQGRMEEAEQLLSELMEMMQNMQIAQGQQGQGQQSPGEQAMEGLQDTLREQQGLSDEAFRDLQEQFSPNAQAGESQGNEGRNGGQGRGDSHEGQGGEGQAQGEGGAQQGQSGEAPGSLADRQEALRDELGRQTRSLPGAGTPEGDAAREALGRAGDAMDEAEDALRDDRTADALGAQSEAMEALREGMRNLGEAMAQQQQQGGQQGQANGQFSPQSRDPLGREAGSDGMIGSEDNMLQSENARRRSRELLDEIRKRSGEQERPEIEKDYLKRLLDRF